MLKTGLPRTVIHDVELSVALPHAKAHSVMIAQVTAFNAAQAPEAMTRIARALGTDNAAAGLYALVLRLGIALSLRKLCMREADLNRAAELATRNPYYNPRAVTCASSASTAACRNKRRSSSSYSVTMMCCTATSTSVRTTGCA